MRLVFNFLYVPPNLQRHQHIFSVNACLRWLNNVSFTHFAASVEITWRPAYALQTWVGLTLDKCKKVDNTVMSDQ